MSAPDSGIYPLHLGPAWFGADFDPVTGLGQPSERYQARASSEDVTIPNSFSPHLPSYHRQAYLQFVHLLCILYGLHPGPSCLHSRVIHPPPLLRRCLLALRSP